MDIQTEVQKIHHQFGVTEKANYEIQKLFDKLILDDRAEQLRLAAVEGRGEQFNCLGGNHAKGIKPCSEWCGEDMCQKPSN